MKINHSTQQLSSYKSLLLLLTRFITLSSFSFRIRITHRNKLIKGVSAGDMCSMSCILVLGILGLSSYAVGTLPDYQSEDANPMVHRNARNCGNGILEPGEECDCGPGIQKCREDHCCHPNCQLKLHALCSDNDPCCEQCKYKPRGAICHKATECSIPEYCTGDKGDCSATSNKRNGANCTGDSGKGICIYGVCKSFNQPCHEAWKSSETEPVKELTKCSSGTICVNQSCVPIRDLVNGHGCPRGGSQGEECSGHGQCTIAYSCHCNPGWKGHDCSSVDDVLSSINNDKPGIVKGVGPEQRDSTSNTTALVGGLVSFVILVSVIFVGMAFKYIPARSPPKDERAAVYPQNHTPESAECDPEGPTQDVS